MNRKFLHLILIVLSICFCSVISAEPEVKPIDPSDIFYSGWQTVKSAEKLEKEEKHSDAWKKYHQAAKYFDTLRRFHTDWKPSIVEGRITSTLTAIKRLEPKAVSEQINKDKITQELTGSGLSTALSRVTPSLPTEAPVANSSAAIRLQMQRLEKEKSALNSDIQILANAVRGAKSKLSEAQRKAAENKLKADLAEKKSAKITAEMQEQQGVNNWVIDKLRKEMKDLNELLNTTRKELGDSRREVETLSIQLAQSNSAVTEITKERDTLRIQYDAISEILEKGDSEGVKALISENVRLGTELKQAADRLAFLETNHDTTKDSLLDAKTELAIAKTRILTYKEKNSEYLLRLKNLSSDLEMAREDLKLAQAQPGGSVNQEETEILKSTVKRLIATQERRSRAEAILWETYQQSKTTIPGMATAFSDLRKTKIELSAEEKNLLADRRPDQEFQNPQRVPLAHAQAHGEALKSEIKGIMPLVSRLFEKERYQAALQILTDLDEQFPGNMQILCTRGVIELKTKDYNSANDLFSEAVTMNEQSDYAHYMLGVTHYKSQDLDNARNAFERSLSLKPTNEKTHLYLGSIAGRQKRFQQSEEHFLTAVKLAPTYADAYYNLSALYLQQKSKFQALQYYEKALQNGKAPDIKLETAIRNLKG